MCKKAKKVEDKKIIVIITYNERLFQPAHFAIVKYCVKTMKNNYMI